MLRHHWSLLKNGLMDLNGWVSLEHVLRACRACHRHGVRSTGELRRLLDLDEAEDDKIRFAYQTSWDSRVHRQLELIRALQGHSIRGLNMGGEGSVLTRIGPDLPKWAD